MSREEISGDFSRNLFSLQIQIQTLLDGAGGENAALLLDTLSELSESERKVALKVFQRALEKLKASGVRLRTQKDEHLAEFEETLYEELVDGMNAVDQSVTEKKFSVVDGGKLPTRKKDASNMVCLQEARRKKEGSITLN